MRAEKPFRLNNNDYLYAKYGGDVRDDQVRDTSVL